MTTGYRIPAVRTTYYDAIERRSIPHLDRQLLILDSFDRVLPPVQLRDQLFVIDHAIFAHAVVRR